ncbi:AraC family transcriptional regulator [Pseudomonas sp. 8O]|uniref:AraC family transcriptional regulator n=1 Tax=Pseudomonas sp. 8O TaxID=2653165 RepID=UPI0012EF00BE|nr:AraC family transcriptional regulator [Pseudomonas sp. 8O]VXC40999.1 Transcriptional regulator, AraC family [Pseudomonas sp. 8O]
MTDSALEKGTISVHLVAEALQAWRRRGLPEAPLLAQAGISPVQLQRPQARVSAQAYARLWLALAAGLDDEFFGMDSRRLKSGTFAFMARTALATDNLGVALDVMVRLLNLGLDDVQLRLERADGLAQVVVRESGVQPLRAFAHFTLWMMVHGLCCWLVGRRLPIVAVELRCTRPDYVADYQVMFGDELRFECPRSRLLLEADCLNLPVSRSHSELRGFLRGAPANILVRYRDPQSLTMRVKACLRSLEPAHWPDFEQLSQRFHMASSTLRRRLAREGQSYQVLKDQVRRDLAVACLDAGGRQFAELAETLGFADASAFYKAFRKWTGTTPGQYCAAERAAVKSARHD